MKQSNNQSPKWKFTPWEIIQGFEGLLVMGACYLTWCLKPLRDRWGLSREEANRKSNKQMGRQIKYHGIRLTIMETAFEQPDGQSNK